MTQTGRMDGCNLPHSPIIKPQDVTDPDDGSPESLAIFGKQSWGTGNAKPTNSGGVYGHTLTFSELGSNNLRIIGHADPTGLLVATPIEGNPNLLSVREYKGY